MASEIKLPELGENLTGGDVVDVKVKAGDTVRQGQTLLEVEAEKSTVEVPAPIAGRITKMLVHKGETIQVGQTLCLMEGANGAKQEGPAEAPVREAVPEQTKAKTPDVGKRDQDAPQVAETIRADGAAKKATAPAEKQAGKEETEKPQGAERRPTMDGRQTEKVQLAPASIAPVPAGPATRRLARELGIDLGQVHGSASGGRITQEDIKAHVRQLASVPASRAAAVDAPPLPDFERWGPVDRQPLDGVRRKTAEQMSLAWRVVPHVTQHDQADVTDLEAFRRQNALASPSPAVKGEESGVSVGEPKLTVTAFAVKAAAIALRQYPQFNASLDVAGGQLVLKRYYHVGIAVDTDRGLLVPVLRDVDRTNIYELAQELAAVAERARQKKLHVDEMRGGTFTITNLGGIGGTGFSPIVNYPEVAILGLSRARLQPIVREGQIVPRLLLPLSLSYDHRVIDGADAARFTRRIAELLENPLLMLLHA
jgi:pyruvate dehydrogenase E2 component (dihydrolipoamide acetyltransferase)